MLPRPRSTPFDILALCVDARENLFANGAPQLYAVEQLTNYTSIPNAPSAPSSAPALSPQRRHLLEQLFFAASTSAIGGDNIASAGFQEAVWEIATETLDANPYDGDLNLGAGNVRITGSGDDTRVRDQANAYLRLLAPSTGVQRLRIWSPVREVRNNAGVLTGYERVVGQELVFVNLIWPTLILSFGPPPVAPMRGRLRFREPAIGPGPERSPATRVARRV